MSVQRPRRSTRTRRYTWDFSKAEELLAGETIASVDSIVSVPTGLTIGTSVISGARVQAKLSGGVASTLYVVTCVITTSGGATLDIDGEQPVY